MFPVFDPNYLFFMLPAILLGLIAQFYVNSKYNKWSRVQNRSGMSGAQVAQGLMTGHGMQNLQLKGIAGHLTDHYDPRNKTLALSQNIAQIPSVAAMAIAAHELGHAQQDKENYFPMRLRSALVPMVNIGTNLGWILIMVGLLIQLSGLAWLGVVAFSGGVVFSLATLPVELDASRRAKVMLKSSGMITSQEEERGVKQVLNAAALTYVAAIITSLMQLLYFASMVSGRSRRR
ncbi:MAG: zinc metallopeptidase [Chloroflexi bacterium]|nr:zinc metallopeptidase [Chloroflexota bacterium]